MAADRILKARVDDALADEVERWAKAHDTDVSGVIRAALRDLLERERRRGRAAAIAREFDRYQRDGLLDPPRGEWKAGGFT